MFGIAVVAVHRAIAARLEGYLCGNAAFIADNIIHLALTPICCAALYTTVRTSAWFVLETIFGKESLFGSSEKKFCSAFTAD